MVILSSTIQLKITFVTSQAVLVLPPQHPRPQLCNAQGLDT